MPSKQQIVIVTGGASGIGAATVDRLLAAGTTVAIADLESESLEAARKMRASQKRVAIHALDVTDEPAAEKTVAAIEDYLGPVTGVVNCAGIAADVPVLDTKVELFRKILDINVVGSFIVGRAAARLMAKRKRGAIVNIGSISGLRGSKGRVAYGSSKGAIVTMTQVMANELAKHGIRVNAVAPGPIDTPMVQKMHTKADRALFNRYVPMHRYAKPEEVASVIEFLLDDDRASYVTGEIIAVDGGYRGAGLILDE